MRIFTKITSDLRNEMYKILAICIFVSNLFGAWVMFNDGTDTYIYNNLNGDIFVRHRGNGENYEDRFIKMPAGVIPPNLQNNANNRTQTTNQSRPVNQNSTNQSNYGANPNTANQNANQQNQIPKEQVDALEKRFQELENNLLNKALE